MKAREAQKKQARAKVKGKTEQNGGTVTEEYQKDEILSPTHPVRENSSDKENKVELDKISDSQPVEPINKKPDEIFMQQTLSEQNEEITQEDSSEEGWQEALPKGRSPMGRKPSGSRRPSLAKINTNFMNASHISRHRDKTANFTSPRRPSNESAASSGSAASALKKFVKSASFGPKSKSASITPAGTEKPSNPKSAPASPALNDHVAKSSSIINSVSVQAAGKLFSYKEVALAPPGTIVKAVAEQNSSVTDTAQAALSKISEGEQAKSLVEEKQIEPDGHTNQSVNEVQHCKQGEISDGLKNASSEKKKVEEISSSSQSTEGNSEISDSGSQNDGSSNNSKASPKNEVLKKQVDKCLVTSSDHYVAENTTSPQEKNNSILNEQTPEKEDASQKDDNGDVSSPLSEGDKQGDSSHNTSPQESEKQGDAESVKETSKKLSAAAPPFNPSTIPVFGSIPVPSFKEHGGILPPPVNIPPMLTVNPIRRSPHQSATARVPYGPRLSGGYNRSGSRVPRNKPAFHNGEHNGEASHFNTPRIMNPHAAEFVPGQPWLPNGYPVASNGYVTSPNGVPLSPNGYPVSPNGMPVSPNGIPVTQNGLPASPVGSVESPSAVTVEATPENENAAETDENTAEPSNNVAAADSDVTNTEAQPVAVENTHSDKSGVDEKSDSENGEKHKCAVEPIKETAAKEICSNLAVEEKAAKRWGDYSDGENEIIEVTS
nr:protein TSS isoform X2 [Ipomoea batatas]